MCQSAWWCRAERRLVCSLLWSFPGQLLWGPHGCPAPHGTEDNYANSSVHPRNPMAATQRPPFECSKAHVLKAQGRGACSPLPGVAVSSPAVAPGPGFCLPPATILTLVEKTGRSLLCPMVQGWDNSAAVPREVGAREETRRKAAKMCQTAHPEGLEAKHSLGLAWPWPRGGLARASGTPTLPPKSPSRVPTMGQKSQCCRACPFPSQCPFPLSPLSVLSPFPKERRLPPACHGAATLCSPAHTLLLGDLCTGRHQRPLSSACQEQSSSPHPRGCEHATEEETRITDSLTPCPAEAGVPPAATTSHGRGSPEGAQRARPGQSPSSFLGHTSAACHCPCSDPLLTSSLCLYRAAAPLARPAARGCPEMGAVAELPPRRCGAESELGPPRGYNTAPFPLSRPAAAAGNVLF